jgi:aminodeoxychorismate synthase component I
MNPRYMAPAELARRCRHLPGFVFFDSALPDDKDNRFSILAACPREVIAGTTQKDWDQLQERLAHSKLEGAIPTRPKLGFPQGMAAGYVEYEGDYCFGIYQDLLVFDHQKEGWKTIGNPVWAKEALDSPRLEEIALEAKLEFKPMISREDFCRMVARAKEYIGAGDIYQVNLSQKFTAPWGEPGDAWGFYQRLRDCSAAPHAAFLSLGGKTVLSSSPELFLQMSGQEIRTKPIKGTRPRFADPVADAQSARELLASQKETAELVMITDLERNDLGRSCQFGSVRVSELLKLEKFAQVWHLVSTVEGRLREGVDHPSALQACFPGGSITGAPKKRAMEIIAELEPVPRGVYTGAMGYFGFNGESQFNIAIRTVVIEEGRAHFHVGAGIVADSDPELEYEETLHKAAGILEAARISQPGQLGQRGQPGLF